jgi:hypothetical protein
MHTVISFSADGESAIWTEDGHLSLPFIVALVLFLTTTGGPYTCIPHTQSLINGILLCRVSQEDRSVFWEIIVSVILRK